MRGAALGLVTAMGGTQRLPAPDRKKSPTHRTLHHRRQNFRRARSRIGLVDAIAQDAVAEALRSAAAGIVNS